MHTIDPKMLEAWGEVLAFGAKKYHQRNFMVVPGMAWSRVWDSLNHHLHAFWSGEWLDAESGLPHLGHALCNLQFIWTYHEHAPYHPGDDRPSSIEYQGKTYAEWEAAFKEASAPPKSKNPDILDLPGVGTVIVNGQGDIPKRYIPDILGALARSSGHKAGGNDK